MTRLPAGAGVVGAAAVAGFSFGPVFGVLPLVVPIAVVCAAVVVADLATRARLGVLRVPLAVLLGLAALVPVLLRDVVRHGAGAVLSAMLDATVHGWLRVLESTWPARPDAATMLFVPVLVLVAGALGIEVLRRDLGPMLALVPPLLVLTVGQLFKIADGATALLLAGGFAAAAGVALATSRNSAPRPGAGRLRVIAVVATAGALVAGVLTFAVVDPLGRAPYTLAAEHQTPQVAASAVNPLTEIGGLLSTPDTVAFRNRTSAPVDRWTLLVLNRFDGSSWSTGGRFQGLGRELAADPAVTVATHREHADIEVVGLPGTWLPTQNRTSGVSGAAPLVDPDTGTLLATGPTGGLRYGLDWTTRDLRADALVAAATSGEASTIALPDDLKSLAGQATGGRGASVSTALLLESWFRDSYKVSGGDDVPTGHGYVQLRHFLLDTKTGTTEQFASAYAVLARSVGIPTRVAVGFRQPPAGPDGLHVVHNSDAVAWPEIHVANVGWVPLDPTGKSMGDGSDAVAKAIEKAKAVPPPTVLPPAGTDGEHGDGGGVSPPSTPPPPPSHWLVWTVAAIVAVALLVSAVPAAKLWRRRRRRTAAVAAGAVVGAWWEVRDRLRDHGVAIQRGMTAREVAYLLLRADGALAEQVALLSRYLDDAVWSGRPVPVETVRQAWVLSDGVRRRIGSTSVRARLRGAFSLRGLRPLTT